MPYSEKIWSIRAGEIRTRKFGGGSRGWHRGKQLSAPGKTVTPLNGNGRFSVCDHILRKIFSLVFRMLVVL